MVTYLKRPELTKRDRETLATFLNGELSQEEAAADLRLPRRQSVPPLVCNLLRALVKEGKIDITSLLKNY